MTEHDAIQTQESQPRPEDYWASIYDACRIADNPGAPSLATFVQDPWGHLEAQGQGQAVTSIATGYEPLLPTQAAVARRLDASNGIDANLKSQLAAKPQRKPQTEPKCRVSPSLIAAPLYIRTQH